MSAPIEVSQSTDEADWVARMRTSSGLLWLPPPFMVSWIMTSTESLMPFFFWKAVSVAFMPPAERALLPPVIGCFSSRMTLAPPSWAVIAAVKPAAPAPMTMMSVFSTGRLSAGTGLTRLIAAVPPGIGMSKVWQLLQ